MKNKQALYLLLTANAISGVAWGISLLAIPWYFKDILDRPDLFGLAYTFITLGSLFWSLYSGTLIDRYSRKRIFIASSGVNGLILLSVAATGFITGQVPVSLVILVFASTIFNFNIHYPTLYAFGQEITEKKDYGKINSYLEIQGQATSVIAGAFAALLLSGTEGHHVNIMGIKLNLPFEIERWELHEIFLLDGITYIIAITLISFIRYNPLKSLDLETGNIIKRLKTGFTFLKSNPLIFLFGNASYLVFVVLLIHIHQLVPIYVDNHLEKHADIYSSAEIYYALGALGAGLGIRLLFHNNLVKGIITLMFVAVTVYFLCAFTKSILVLFIFSVLIGISNAGVRIMRVTYLFNHVPNQVIGRVSSVFHVFNISMRALLIGIFSISFFATGSNITWAYFISGSVVLVGIIPLVLRYNKLVDLNKVKD